MDIGFCRSRDRHDQTIVTRGDGVRLSVPVYGPLDPIPHDLAHYVVERELELRQGFWASVADGVIFDGMRVLAGRQLPHARERSRALLKANHQSILFAELLVGSVLHVVGGVHLAEAALGLESHIVRAHTRADGVALLQRLTPAVTTMCARWQAIPLGEMLRVTWPDGSKRRAQR